MASPTQVEHTDSASQSTGFSYSANQPTTGGLFSMSTAKAAATSTTSTPPTGGFSFGGQKTRALFGGGLTTHCIHSNGFTFPPIDYRIYDHRLATFKFWPCPDKVAPTQLARAGLRYLGEADKCICPWCDIIIHRWEYLDEAQTEHQKHSKNCAYLQMIMPSA